MDLADEPRELREKMNEQQNEAESEPEIKRREQPTALKKNKLENVFDAAHGKPPRGA
jgi:hypothetical protein